MMPCCRSGAGLVAILAALVAVLTIANACATQHRPQQAPAENPSGYTAYGGGHLIRSVSPGGQFVTLEDGSVWEIEPSVRFQTADWQVDAPVTVRRAQGEGPFVYELVNTQDDEGALARYVPPPRG
jgi:hypothetical protein